MESDRKNTPKTIEANRTNASIGVIRESIDAPKSGRIIPSEKLLVDILSEKELENIGEAINGRNPWEH